MFYGEVFKALNKARIKYVVVGGIAVVLYGYPRLTQDLDLIVSLEDKNLGKLFDVLKSIGYSPKIPITKKQFIDRKQRQKWKKEKNMIVFSFVEQKPPFQIIDIFIDEPINFNLVYEKRKNTRIDGVNIPLINIDQLIKLKQIAGRDIDQNDIVQLKEIKRIRQK